MKPVCRLVLAAMTLAALAGCLGYRLGPVAETRYQSIAVPVFRNRTLQPQLEGLVANAIIERLQQDGTLRVQNRSTADAVLFGTITGYAREPVRVARTDTGLPREYRVTMTAVVEVLDQRTGQHILKPTTFEGRAETFIGSDLQSADEQIIPLLAEDLARQIVARLTEPW